MVHVIVEWPLCPVEDWWEWQKSCLLLHIVPSYYFSYRLVFMRSTHYFFNQTKISKQIVIWFTSFVLQIVMLTTISRHILVWLNNSLISFRITCKYLRPSRGLEYGFLLCLLCVIEFFNMFTSYILHSINLKLNVWHESIHEKSVKL